MSGGRSSQRLIEEILSFVPHTDLLSVPPVQQLNGDRTGYSGARTRQLLAVTPVGNGVSSDQVEEWLVGDGVTKLHGFFSDSGWHFFAAISTPASSPIDYDWHITDRSTDFDGEIVVDYRCSMTGATLNLRLWPPRLEPVDWQMFEAASILQRFNARSSAYPGDTPPPSVVCIETLYSILRNSMVQDPPKPIPFSSARASVHIDVSILERKLGFSKDNEAQLYHPPVLETLEDKLHYTGMLTEVAAHVLLRSQDTFGTKWPVRISPVSQDLQTVLGVVPTDLPLLSNRYYGALGSSSTFSDDALWERYSLQTRHDPRNTPHYLESLKEIAQQRNSEELQMRVMELISVGTQTLSAIEDAFTALDLTIDGIYTDEEIAHAFVSKFESLLTTDAVNQDLARKISAIADFRQSPELSRLTAAITLSYSDAMHALGADEAVPNAGLFDRVDARIRAGPIAAYEGRTALRVIGVHRQDPELLSRYEELVTPEGCTSSEGYSRLGAAADMSDKDILAVFEVRAQEENNQVLLLRQALRAVGESRDSQLIEDYLACRVSEASLREPANVGPVGLWNIGNTCYLNSLLQYYFTIDPLRELVSNFGEDQAQLDDKSMENKTIGGRQVPFAEVERSQQFVNSLGTLFKEMSGTTDRYVVPAEDLAYMALVPPEEDVAAQAAERIAAAEQAAAANRAAAAAENVRKLAAQAAEARLIQSSQQDQPEPLSGSDEVQTELLQDDGYSSSSSSSSSSLSMVDVMDHSQSENVVRVYDHPLDSGSDEAMEMRVDLESVYSDVSNSRTDSVRRQTPTIPTRDLHSALQRQQDVTECIENVLFQLEAAVKATGAGPDGEQLDLIKDLFYGTTLQTLQQESGQGERRTKSELFSTLMVDVADGARDIYSALDNYFGYEVIDMAEGKTIRTVTAKTLPPILQVQIQRVQFDRSTGQPYKSTAPLIFEDVVYLDRYLDSSDPDILERRARVRQWRASLEGITTELAEARRPLANGQSLVDTIESAIEWCECQGLSETDETVQHLFKRHMNLQDQLESLEAKRADLQNRIDSEFAHLTQHGYKIYALFIHRGQVSFGHYWVYIRDLASNKFYKYNDENVTEAQYDEVIDFSPENTATPYFLVFVREDFVSNLSSRCSTETAEPRVASVEMSQDPSTPEPELTIESTLSSKPTSEPELHGSSLERPESKTHNGIEIVDLTES